MTEREMNEKVNTLVEALQADHGPAYALGWLSSMLDHIGRDLQQLSCAQGPSSVGKAHR